MKKIQSKIIVIIAAITLAIVSINGALGSLVTSYATTNAVEATLLETSKLGALAAQNMIATYTSTVTEIASNSILSGGESTLSEKEAFLQNRRQAYYMRAAGYVSTSGYDSINHVDVSGEPFFQRAMQGESYMSSPYITEDGSDLFLIVSAPVMKDGKVDSVIYFSCDTSILQSIVESVKVGESENSDAYILDHSGTTIAYKEIQSVLDRENVIEQAGQNSKDQDLQALAAIEKKMVSGETGVGTYQYSDGAHYIQSYAPIASTDGWSIAITVDKDEFMRPAAIGSLLQLAASAVMFVIALLCALATGRSMARPIVRCAQRLELLSKGDLKTPVPEVKSRDEIKVLANSTSDLIESFNQIIDEVDFSLERIANGDLTEADSSSYYPGDFAALQVYLKRINQRLNQTMGGIISAAEQVSAGADQVAASGTTLSHGATEQATAVDMLSNEIHELSENIKSTAAGARNASDISNAAREQLLDGIGTMNEMLQAVHEIEGNSSEISKILKVIDDIAFQTNILALNAAVEAARAGAAGKGFAVVADEVRNLAAKSAESAKTTAVLIDQSVSVTQKGANLANLTSEALKRVMESSQESVEHINQISDKVQEQSQAVVTINERIQEISSVVQSNSATSEESAATAEQLSSQAELMKGMVSKFKLDNSLGADSSVQF